MKKKVGKNYTCIFNKCISGGTMIYPFGGAPAYTCAKAIFKYVCESCSGNLRKIILF